MGHVALNLGSHSPVFIIVKQIQRDQIVLINLGMPDLIICFYELIP